MQSKIRRLDEMVNNNLVVNELSEDHDWEWKTDYPYRDGLTHAKVWLHWIMDKNITMTRQRLNILNIIDRERQVV